MTSNASDPTTDAPDHVHKATKRDPDNCRICGAPMAGSGQAIAAAFDGVATPVASDVPPPAASTGLTCIRPGCGEPLVLNSVCCEACGLPITWAGGVPHQELPSAAVTSAPVAAPTARPAIPGLPDTSPTRPTNLVADPDAVPSGSTAAGLLKVIVRCNRDIHDRVAHPEMPAPTDPTPHTYEIKGDHAEFGRPNDDPSNEFRIVAFDNAVSEEHATFTRLADGTWEIKDHSRNGTRLNHSRLDQFDAQPVKVGDVVWCGYYTELEIVAAA